MAPRPEVRAGGRRCLAEDGFAAPTGPILLIVDYVSPIMWTIGLTFLITGIVLVAGDAGEKSRGARGRRFRY
jgi:hypothetical protein